jgi:diguanylate cyclase (GGDEF)-like protein
MDPGKKHSIGLFVPEIEGDYCNLLTRGVSDAAAENGINLFVFSGKSIRIPYQFQYQYNVIYELALNGSLDGIILASGLLYSFISHQEFERFYTRFKPVPMVSISVPLEGMPAVIINNRTGLHQALRHLIRVHGKKRIAFIRGPRNNFEAEERYSVYMEVLRENGLRFDPRLVCDGDFTHYSATAALSELIDRRKTDFDAVAAANDEMALKVLDLLRQRGYEVPGQIAVTGFDNVGGARLCHPSLTTVQQPVYEMGRRALGLMLGVLRGKKPTNVTLDTGMVIRESCGCLPESAGLADAAGGDYIPAAGTGEFIERETENLGRFGFDKARTGELVNHLFRDLPLSGSGESVMDGLIREFSGIFYRSDLNEEEVGTIQGFVTRLRIKALELCREGESTRSLEDFFQKIRSVLVDMVQKGNASLWSLHNNGNRSLRSVLNLMISYIHDRETALGMIVDELKAAGIRNCAVFLYEGEILHKLNSVWTNPEKAVLTLAYNEEQGAFPYFRKEPETCEVSRIFDHPSLPRQGRHTILVNPLFFMDVQIGIILCELEFKDPFIYESIFIEISCALKLASLMAVQTDIQMKLRAAMQDLEEYNTKLNNISQTDELTGLLNRRGFISLAVQSLELAARAGKSGVLFYADLDGLKSINDRFGHKEGDFALRQTSSILKKTFRNADIVARLGGDEFIIFAVDTMEESIPDILARLKQCSLESNRQSGRPYSISISVGYVPFSTETSVDIDVLMSEADACLYEQKKVKQRSRLE